MKKIIFPMLVLPLMALCFSMTLNAQSSEMDLDQVELMKQLIGTWTTETAVDSTYLWEVIPNNNGYEHNSYWQAKGETYRTAKGLMGFTWENQTVNNSILWTNGILTRDMGKFVSDKKMMWERFNAKHNHIVGSFEIYFITPDNMNMIFKWRGMEETWDDAVVSEWTYTRVKK